MSLGLFGPHRFRGEILDRREGGGPEQTLEVVGGHLVEERRGGADVRGAGEEDVEDDVGVEEPPSPVLLDQMRPVVRLVQPRAGQGADERLYGR